MLCECLDILIDMPIGALKSPDQKKKKWIYTDAFNMCIAQGEIYRQMRVRQSMNIPILLFSFWKHEFHIYNNNETAITLKPVENNIVAAIVFFFFVFHVVPHLFKKWILSHILYVIHVSGRYAARAGSQYTYRWHTHRAPHLREDDTWFLQVVIGNNDGRVAQNVSAHK